MGADFAAPAGKKALGRPRVVPLRGVIDALLYFFGRRVRGVCRRAIFRSARPCNDTFMPGRPKGYWKRSISCWSNRLGSAVAAKPAHPADIQDRDGAGKPIPPRSRFLSIVKAMGRRADLRLVWAESLDDDGCSANNIQQQGVS